ncbi:MAG TPA: CPBP family glutamic-type intramembrane protease [Dehalococcoidia bacterium]|jgi:membrane protease YdiL (CAAX protease family)|nr:CPBP family glutamic-type intramembrane protease [Dehalococcoidia bacterium]
MATDFDPYRILEVERSAGQAEIDQAYRKQWAAYPSDAAPEARLREIQAAYRILSDPEERRAYDQRLAERRTNGSTWAGEAWPAGSPVTRVPVETTSPGEPESGLTGDVPERVPWGLKDMLKAIAIVVGVVFAASIPIFLLADVVAGDQNIDDSGNALAVEFLASAVFQFTALWTAWRFSVRQFHLDWGALGLRWPKRGIAWLPYTLAAGGLFVAGMYGLALDAVGVHPDASLPDAALDNTLPLVIIIVLTVAVAPVVEEIFFRGFIFAGLSRRWGFFWGALGSGTLFGIAHVGNPGYIYLIPPIIVIGAMFAWGYRYSNSIFITMAAHMLFNSIQIIGTLLNR